MKRVLLIITIIAAVVIIIYGASLVLDYMVTSKYHVQDGTKDEIIYTTSERAKEIAFLNRYFYLTIAFALISLISSLAAIFSKN